MLENKRLFIFAHQQIAKQIMDVFLMPRTDGKNKRYQNYGYAYHTHNEIATMMECHVHTNLFMADYFFVEVAHVAQIPTIIDTLLFYQKPIIAIYDHKKVCANLHPGISFSICMDCFEQDLKDCIHHLDARERNVF